MIAAAALAMMIQAQTGAAALAPAFENTLVSIYPDGRQALLWLEPDGRYRGQGRTGSRTSGVWRVRGGEICLNQRRPFPAPITYCTPIVRGDVGARWTAKAVTGETITVEVRRGR